jgi:adenylate cyclase class 2
LAKRNRETEVKIRIQSVAALRSRLKRLGLLRIHPRTLEDNVLFDTPDRALRKMRAILRLRRYGSRWTVTYKGTPEADPYFKSREELESHLESPEAMRAIFQVLGLIPVFRYQKFRTEYVLPPAGRERFPLVDIALDETPIGNFIELEGSRRAIDWMARELGYSRRDYSTASYGALYLEDCARNGRPPGDMLFPDLKRRTGLKKRAIVRDNRTRSRARHVARPQGKAKE